MNGQRVAIVTGANRGIGHATAVGLAQRDHCVVVCARSIIDAEHAASEIGHDSVPMQLDVTDADSVTAAVTAILDMFGRLDVVVNNAGGHFDEGIRPSEVTDADLSDAFEVNTIGPMRLIRAALPHLLARRWGRIVNVSSRAGTFSATWANAPAYGISKAALNMLTFHLAKELHGTGVIVNACCPGWVRTRMGGEEAERSAAEGADTPIWLATLPGPGPNGLLFADRAVIEW